MHCMSLARTYGLPFGFLCCPSIGQGVVLESCMP